MKMQISRFSFTTIFLMMFSSSFGQIFEIAELFKIPNGPVGKSIAINGTINYNTIPEIGFSGVYYAIGHSPLLFGALYSFQYDYIDKGQNHRVQVFAEGGIGLHLETIYYSYPDYKSLGLGFSLSAGTGFQSIELGFDYSFNGINKYIFPITLRYTHILPVISFGR